MTPTPDSLTRQWFQEVWNEGREDAIDRLLAPDAIVHGLGGSDAAPMRGPEAFKPVFRTFREARSRAGTSSIF
ncbi:MAG: nuclear transport factor 2 family protein [Vicinamibacterales bacterium]